MARQINYRLKKAFLSGNSEEIENCLFEGACPNLKCIVSTSLTLLHHSPDLKITKLLLEYGADINAVDNYGQTPLHSATSYRKGLAVIEELLLNGADINAKDFAGMTPLHYAVTYRNEVNVIRGLLRHGANVQATDREGDTVLHLAVGCGGGYVTNQEIITELLEFGANVTTKNKYSTALEVALEKGDKNCAKRLVKVSVFVNFERDPNKIAELCSHIALLNNSELSNYRDRCFAEMNKVTTETICGNVLLKSFLIKRDKSIKPLYPGNKDIKKQISDKFIIYSDMIMPSIEICLKRGCLFNQLVALSIYTRSEESNKDVILNCDCLYKIAEYLSNDELLNLITAFLVRDSLTNG